MGSVAKSQPAHSNNVYITVFFENRIYGFTYQRDASEHQSSCLSWVEPIVKMSADNSFINFSIAQGNISK